MAVIQGVYTTIRDIKRIISRSSQPGFGLFSMARSYLRLKFSSAQDLVTLKRVRVLNFDIHYHDSKTLFQLFQDIFVTRDYQTAFDHDSPVIIDCGSNIGVSILYFKAQYPRARIIGFEPNPDQFKVLEKNITANQLTDVTLFRKAVCDKNGTIDFFINEDSPGSLNTSLIKRGTDIPKISVETSLLSDHITESVDLLKLDIEGAEESVLRDLEAHGKLRNIRQVICEYHHHIEKGVDRLSITLGILERAGFGYQLLATSGHHPSFDSYQDILIYAFNRNLD
jgi:FkbM family methyltransferase